MTATLQVGTRVRCQRLFFPWRQTPGTVVDVDPYLRVAKVTFDNGVTKWVAVAVLEVGAVVEEVGA